MSGRLPYVSVIQKTLDAICVNAKDAAHVTGERICWIASSPTKSAQNRAEKHCGHTIPVCQVLEVRECPFFKTTTINKHQTIGCMEDMLITASSKSVCRCTGQNPAPVCYECDCRDEQECQLIELILECIISANITSKPCRNLILLVYSCSPKDPGFCVSKCYLKK